MQLTAKPNATTVNAVPVPAAQLASPSRASTAVVQRQRPPAATPPRAPHTPQPPRTPEQAGLYPAQAYLTPTVSAWGQMLSPGKPIPAQATPPFLKRTASSQKAVQAADKQLPDTPDRLPIDDARKIALAAVAKKGSGDRLSLNMLRHMEARGRTTKSAQTLSQAQQQNFRQARMHAASDAVLPRKGSDRKAAHASRRTRYVASKRAKGRQPLGFAPWYDQAMRNWFNEHKGNDAEAQALALLGVQSNNAAGRRAEYPCRPGAKRKTTRPDGDGYAPARILVANPDGTWRQQIGPVHALVECKSHCGEPGTKHKKTICMDPQIVAQHDQVERLNATQATPAAVHTVLLFHSPDRHMGLSRPRKNKVFRTGITVHPQESGRPVCGQIHIVPKGCDEIRFEAPANMTIWSMLATLYHYQNELSSYAKTWGERALVEHVLAKWQGGESKHGARCDLSKAEPLGKLLKQPPPRAQEAPPKARRTRKRKRPNSKSKASAAQATATAAVTAPSAPGKTADDPEQRPKKRRKTSGAAPLSDATNRATN